MFSATKFNCLVVVCGDLMAYNRWLFGKSAGVIRSLALIAKAFCPPALIVSQEDKETLLGWRKLKVKFVKV
jgi:hypothetical protein